MGTGDGIVQNGGQATANKMRTVPLWGGRTRDRLMHDLQTFTRNDAFNRNEGDHVGGADARMRSLVLCQVNQL